MNNQLKHELCSIKDKFTNSLHNTIKKNYQESTLKLLENYGLEAENWLYYILCNFMKNPAENEMSKDISKYKSLTISDLKFQDTKLLGAHFRGISTIEGRRSTIIVEREVYDQTSLNNYSYFNKIFLKVYLLLFNRKDTLNELWVDRSANQKNNKQNSLLVHFEWNSNIGNKDPIITINRNKLTINKKACDLLIDGDIYNIYLHSVLESAKQNSTDNKKESNRKANERSWDEKIDQGSTLVLKNLNKTYLKKVLEARQITLSHILMQHQRLTNDLLIFFSLKVSEPEDKEKKWIN